MCERASKHSQTPRILPRRDSAPGFEIPGSATWKDDLYYKPSSGSSEDAPGTLCRKQTC